MRLADVETIVVVHPADKIVRIVPSRPKTRNAQNFRLLYELDAALDRAAQDNRIGTTASAR